MERHEGAVTLQVVTPDDTTLLKSAATLIAKRAQEGHVVYRPLAQIQEIARRGAMAFVNSSKEVVAFGGITKEYPDEHDLQRRIKAAEYGAMVTASGYEGNGFSTELTRAVAQRYLEDATKQSQRTGEFILFAMAHIGGPGGKVFEKLHLQQIPADSLPPAAFDEGRDYINFNLNALRRDRPS